MNSLITSFDDICFFVVLILIFVSWILIKLIHYSSSFRSIYSLNFRLIPKNNIFLETIWSIIPFLIFIFLFLPLTKVLSYIGYYHNINKNLLNIYNIDLEFYKDDSDFKDFLKKKPISIKCIGNQRFWTYEIYSDIDNYYSDLDYILKKRKNFYIYSGSAYSSGSYIKPEIIDNFLYYKLRLISNDRCLFLPFKQFIEFNITSNYVIHKQALPYSGIKIDSISSILSFFKTYFNTCGFYYGQSKGNFFLKTPKFNIYDPFLKIPKYNEYDSFLKTYNNVFNPVLKWDFNSKDILNNYNSGFNGNYVASHMVVSKEGLNHDFFHAQKFKIVSKNPHIKHSSGFLNTTSNVYNINRVSLYGLRHDADCRKSVLNLENSGSLDYRVNSFYDVRSSSLFQKIRKIHKINSQYSCGIRHTVHSVRTEHYIGRYGLSNRSLSNLWLYHFNVTHSFGSYTSPSPIDYSLNNTPLNNLNTVINNFNLNISSLDGVYNQRHNKINFVSDLKENLIEINKYLW